MRDRDSKANAGLVGKSACKPNSLTALPGIHIKKKTLDALSAHICNPQTPPKLKWEVETENHLEVYSPASLE